MQRHRLVPSDGLPPLAATHGDVRTVEAVLNTPDDQLAELWPTAASSDSPIIHLPGVIPAAGGLAITT